LTPASAPPVPPLELEEAPEELPTPLDPTPLPELEPLPPDDEPDPGASPSPSSTPVGPVDAHAMRRADSASGPSPRAERALSVRAAFRFEAWGGQDGSRIWMKVF
jgi:hypothetical protein